MPADPQPPAPRPESGVSGHTDTIVRALSTVGAGDAHGTRYYREIGSGIPARRPARSVVDVQPIGDAPRSSAHWLTSIGEWVARIDMRSDVAVLGELLINGRGDNGPSSRSPHRL
jgi:hypothetical protein